MADTSYRVWFGCRINGVEYERGELVTLDSANAGVQAALNHPGAPRIRVNDGGAGGVPDDTTIPFYIGRSAYADNTYTMMGRVAGVAIYHSGLSAARILAHAQAAGLA